MAVCNRWSCECGDSECACVCVRLLECNYPISTVKSIEIKFNIRSASCWVNNFSLRRRSRHTQSNPFRCVNHNLWTNSDIDCAQTVLGFIFIYFMLKSELDFRRNRMSSTDSFSYLARQTVWASPFHLLVMQVCLCKLQKTKLLKFQLEKKKRKKKTAEECFNMFSIHGNVDCFLSINCSSYGFSYYFFLVKKSSSDTFMCFSVAATICFHYLFVH